MLQVTATSESGVIQGVRHREFTAEAIQYHPESVLSEGGLELMGNFLRFRGGRWADCPEFGVGQERDGDVPQLVEKVDKEVHGEPVPAALQSATAATPSNARGGAPAQAAGPSKDALPTILTQIHAQRLLDVSASSSHLSSTPAQLEKHLALNLAPPLIAVLPRLRQTAPLPAILAEVKRASPSKGSIAPDTNAPEQALKYARAGASVISVLTEPKWFKGSLLDMLAVRLALGELPDRPAVLRKDFILATYQIDEARLYGADTVLLIVAMLDPPLLVELYAHSVALGMEPLVEVNNPAELTRALALGAKLIGVNNRNLHDFEVDMTTTSRVNEALKQEGGETVLVALSGITGRESVEGYLKEGVQGLLVGESLMRAKEPRVFIEELLGLAPASAAASSPASAYSTESPAPAAATAPSSAAFMSPAKAPLVKICGIRSLLSASRALSAGADLLGLIFVPKSKRCVSLSVASSVATLVREARFSNPPRPYAPASASSAAVAKGWFAHHADQLAAGRLPLLVGVFQNQPLAEVLHVVREVGLDVVQLHGQEPAEWASFIPVPVIRVCHVSPTDGSISPADVCRPKLNAFVLLDAGSGGAGSGGQGEAFDWSIARDVAQGADGLPILLAGGLNPDNVGQAVAEVQPWCVDVSSGVEGDNGEKVEDRCREFVRRAKQVAA